MQGEILSQESNLSDYNRFREFLEDACGIVLGDNKQYLVSSRLSRLMTENNMASLGQLLDEITSKNNRGLQENIIEAMTTNETSWFRDTHPFTNFTEIILPDICKDRTSPIRIWSAACSSGQEPYSISMSIHEFQMFKPGLLKSDVKIIATDISPAMLDFARKAKYESLAMARGLSDERKQRYFQEVFGGWEITPNIRSRVEFRELNLMDNYALLGRFDVIFCRNVLIYFATKSKQDILERMTKALNPGGYLYLGGSEALFGVGNKYEVIRTSGGVIYKLKS
jgi:chemotaxis protein methyltransferase CheR